MVTYLCKTIPEAVIVGETKVGKDQLDRQLLLAHSAYSVPGSGFRLFTCLDYISEDAQTASYQWFLVWGDEDFTKDPATYWTTTATKQEMLDYALERVQPLDERLTEVVRSTKPDGIVHPPLQFRDLILDTMPNTRCTLLGDAAHPMAPFPGRGGVQAMIDAMNLAKTLAKAKPEDLLSSLKEYQDEMLLRAAEIVKLSRRVGQNPGKIVVWGHEIREFAW
jgi:2-polyprenyl-6-methoxyphenol hydroxylase-like FAD-dependent oxidoreductase